MDMLVSERRSRVTGTVVQVIDNRDGSFDSGDLPWFTICVDHGGVCSHQTRRLAERFAPVPDEWCFSCQDSAATGTNRLTEERLTHWLPQPLNEGARTACGLDVNEHPRIEWRTSQNEADCMRCLTANDWHEQCPRCPECGQHRHPGSCSALLF